MKKKKELEIEQIEKNKLEIIKNQEKEEKIKKCFIKK